MGSHCTLLLNSLTEFLVLLLLLQSPVAKPLTLVAITSTPTTAKVTSLVDLWEHVNKTCLSNSCDETINRRHLQTLERNIQPLADPCENFYEYACGSWSNVHENDTMTMLMADDQVTANYAQLFERRLRERRRRLPGRRHILNMEDLDHNIKIHHSQPEQQQLNDEELSSPEHDQLLTKLLEYYAVCKSSVATSDKLQLSGYLRELESSHLWQHDRYNWLATLAQLTRYGYPGHLLHFQIEQRNASTHLLSVQPYIVKKPPLQFTMQLHELLHNYTQRDYDTLVTQFQRLESDLAAIMSEACTRQQPAEQEHNECDFERQLSYRELLQQSGADIDWPLYFRLQLDRPLKPEDTVQVDDLASIVRVARYLNQHADQELLFLYTLAHFLGHLQQQPHMPHDTGASSLSCMRHMRKIFHTPMAYLYDRAYYAHQRHESDAVVLQIFEQLRAQYAHTLERNALQLPAEAVLYMRRKLDHMRINIGNLPQHVTPLFYWQQLQGLNLSDNFYHNHLQALRHAYTLQRNFIDLPSGSPYHSYNYHDPNVPNNMDSTPYFHCLRNMIVVPYTYLQTPYYDRHFWPALLYGDLATTLGHELMHAFDTAFLAYDYAGNYAEVPSSLRQHPRYIRSVNCLTESNDQAAEHMADFSGTRLVLDTFLQDEEFLRQNGKLVFLQFAQFFCESHVAAAEHHAQDPTHDLGSRRLNDTLAHMPEFAVAFNCPQQSRMTHPDDSCELWQLG